MGRRRRLPPPLPPRALAHSCASHLFLVAPSISPAYLLIPVRVRARVCCGDDTSGALLHAAVSHTRMRSTENFRRVSRIQCKGCVPTPAAGKQTAVDVRTTRLYHRVPPSPRTHRGQSHVVAPPCLWGGIVVRKRELPSLVESPEAHDVLLDVRRNASEEVRRAIERRTRRSRQQGR